MKYYQIFLTLPKCMKSSCLSNQHLFLRNYYQNTCVPLGVLLVLRAVLSAQYAWKVETQGWECQALHKKMLVTSFLRIWSHLLKKSLMENFIFCAVQRFLSFAHKHKLIAFRWKKKLVKVDQFFSGDQYFSPINNFAQLKLTPTKKFFVSYFFSWIKTK